MTFTRKQVIEKLREAQGGDSLRIFGERIRASAPYLSDIYLGRRTPGPKILSFLGLEKIQMRVSEPKYRKARKSLNGGAK
jgi:hypothetical protein